MTLQRGFRQSMTAGVSRRWFLQVGAAIGGALGTLRPTPAGAQAVGRQPGKPGTPYGERSPFETAVRVPPPGAEPLTGRTRTPLQDSHGIITPSSLHFERHHAGVPVLDPAAHRLLIHGLVDRPLLFTVEDLKRLPSVSRIHFLECSGNSSSEWRPRATATLQVTHGMASCSEWTGVLLSTLLREAGVQPAATWLVAEGADACKLTRSIPITKALDDAIVAYGQNGEALRPEQGYPLRLFLPGWEGNANVKWLSRLKVVDKPYYTRWETSKYTDLMPDGTSRIFTFDTDAKSLITRPSGGQKLTDRGTHEITGLAWSGRGVIRRVEVSTDGGRTWQDAELQRPILPKAFTSFRMSWRWEGAETILQSRATDETGYVQPTRAALIAVRGTRSTYHYNGIQSWRVSPDGAVENVVA